MMPDGHQAYKHCSASGRAAEIIVKRTTINEADNSVLACRVKVECGRGLRNFEKMLRSSAKSIPLSKLRYPARTRGWRLAVMREQMIPDGH